VTSMANNFAATQEEIEASIVADLLESLDALDKILVALRFTWSDPEKCLEQIGLARNALQVVLINSSLLKGMRP
jgi:hypothetical protein